MGIPHIVAHYSVDDEYEWPMGRLPFKYCDLVHSDSIHYAKKWAELLKTDWFCARDVAPESLFDLGFERLYGEGAKLETAGTVRVGIVGTLMPRKSQLEAIHAVSMLIREGHRIRLTIFGDVNAHPDYYRQCRKALDRLGISDCVVFKGHVEDLREIYANLDIVLSVSTYVQNISESFATSIKEATASGTLVVASRVGGIGELMKNEINCILTIGCEPNQIAEAILRAMSLSQGDALALKRNAFRMAREEFHPRRGLLDLLSMYNSALRIQPSPTRPPLRVDSLQQKHAETFVPLEMLPTRLGLLQVARSPAEVRRIIVASIRVLEREGIGSLWRQIRIKIRRREFRIAEG
jgi:glycosyltransferase involved in cell wall biosynthesis